MLRTAGRSAAGSPGRPAASIRRAGRCWHGGGRRSDRAPRPDRAHDAVGAAAVGDARNAPSRAGSPRGGLGSGPVVAAWRWPRSWSPAAGLRAVVEVRLARRHVERVRHRLAVLVDVGLVAERRRSFGRRWHSPSRGGGSWDHRTPAAAPARRSRDTSGARSGTAYCGAGTRTRSRSRSVRGGPELDAAPCCCRRSARAVSAKVACMLAQKIQLRRKLALVPPTRCSMPSSARRRAGRT